MEQDILISLMVVALGCCAAIGFIVKSQSRMLQIQSKMLSLLVDITNAIVERGGLHAVMPDWRQLPPDAQLMMRNSLIEILREMDGEMPKRH